MTYSKNFWHRSENVARKDWDCVAGDGTIQRGSTQVHYTPGSNNWKHQDISFRYHPECDPGFKGLPTSE